MATKKAIKDFIKRYKDAHGYPDTDWQELQREAHELGITQQDIADVKKESVAEKVEF